MDPGHTLAASIHRIVLSSLQPSAPSDNELEATYQREKYELKKLCGFNNDEVYRRGKECLVAILRPPSQVKKRPQVPYHAASLREPTGAGLLDDLKYRIPASYSSPIDRFSGTFVIDMPRETAE